MPRCPEANVKSGDIADTTVFSKVLYCKVRNVFFLCLFMYYFCEKYKPIIEQYHIASCISWVSGLTL